MALNRITNLCLTCPATRLQWPAAFSQPELRAGIDENRGRPWRRVRSSVYPILKGRRQCYSIVHILYFTICFTQNNRDSIGSLYSTAEHQPNHRHGRYHSKEAADASSSLMDGDNVSVVGVESGVANSIHSLNDNAFYVSHLRSHTVYSWIIILFNDVTVRIRHTVAEKYFHAVDSAGL